MSYVVTVVDSGGGPSELDVIGSPRPRRPTSRRRRASRAINPVWEWPSFLYVPVVQARRVFTPRKPNSYSIETASQWLRRYEKEMRGKYRVFNDAEYRFYWSLRSIPLETDAPKATNATLAFSPADTFGNGVWNLSVSFFNGCIDSGFLPIGPNGETYLRLDIEGDVQVLAPPDPPRSFELVVDPEGVVRVVGLYFQTGALRATQWAISYRTDGLGDPGIIPYFGDRPTLPTAKTITRRPSRHGYVSTVVDSGGGPSELDVIGSARRRRTVRIARRGAYAIHPAVNSAPLIPSPFGPFPSEQARVAIPAKGVAVLDFSIPAQTHGTIVSVRLQTRRVDPAHARYSEDSIKIAVASNTSLGIAGGPPTLIRGGDIWHGRAPTEL